jgi:peptidoglycan/xylan/chitin deacetylase (PgdA/CDA1 family)
MQAVIDGHPADLRVAEFLACLGLPATFYIPARNAERPVIAHAQVRDLATQFEIGSHTINHVALTSLSTQATQAYSRSPAIQIRHALAERNLAGLKAYASRFRFARQWGEHLGIAMRHVERQGGIVHLSLHGWEIDEQQQ